MSYQSVSSILITDKVIYQPSPEMTAVVWLGADETIMVVPLAKDRRRWRTEVNHVEQFRWEPSLMSVLGEKVLSCLAISAASIGHISEEIPPSLKASGAKNDRAFAKSHHSVYVEVPVGSDSVIVEYWPRNANFMFVGPPDGRPDLTVVLPVDATAVMVGEAVVRVLRAGGADLGIQPAGLPPVDAADDRIGYCEFRASLLSDFQASRTSEDSVVETVIWLFEETFHTATDDPPLFVCAVVTCSLICLRDGFLPDFLVGPARQLGDISNLLGGEDLVAYRGDAAELAGLLGGGFRVVESDSPPDFFPGTWVESRQNLAWWNGLLHGKAR